MTYFLMLLFVFSTLFLLALGRLFSATYAGMVCCLLWAALGTFFFHNIW